MDSFRIPFDLRDGVVAFACFLGFLGSIFAMARGRVMPGILAMCGFVLCGLDPVLELVVYRLMTPQNADNGSMWNWIYAGVSASATFVGLMLIAVAVMLRDPKTTAERR